MKTDVGDTLNDLRGRMGKWVYKRFDGNVIIAKRPKPVTTPPTEAQVRQHRKFARAAAYARSVFADPAQKAVYAAKAKSLGRSTVFALAMGDYLKPPVVEELDLTGYDGHVGNTITALATDDTGVIGVKVTIKDGTTGTILEVGEATLQIDEWVYHARTEAPRDRNVLIEAEARDRAGNETALSDTWHA